MKFWYKKGILSYLLLPFALLFSGLVALRRWLYRIGIFTQFRPPVPVIVVGNICIGGTGKTPLVMAIVNFLKAKGYHVGVVSRGYKSHADSYPYHVTLQSSAHQAGDEPLLICQKTGAPVIIDADRVRAVQKLLANYPCDVIVTDDGLQHYALSRDVEILVVDGSLRFGNGFLLPAGPLRESVHRLQQVDFVVANGNAQANELFMELVPGEVYRQNMPEERHALITFRGQKVHAVAGIGNPQRFFQLLRAHGIDIIEHAFADHHSYTHEDLNFAEAYPILMTEKDAVKCSDLQHDTIWVVPVTVSLPKSFFDKLLTKLSALLAKDSQNGSL